MGLPCRTRPNLMKILGTNHDVHSKPFLSIQMQRCWCTETSLGILKQCVTRSGLILTQRSHDHPPKLPIAISSVQNATHRSHSNTSGVCKSFLQIHRQKSVSQPNRHVTGHMDFESQSSANRPSTKNAANIPAWIGVARRSSLALCSLKWTQSWQDSLR